MTEHMSSDNELVRRIEALEDAVIAITFAYGDQPGTEYLRRALDILESSGETEERKRMFGRVREWSGIRFPSE